MSSPAPHDDRQMLDRFLQENDQAALALLVRHYLPLIYSVAVRITGQPQLAEEVCQDVFLKLVQKPPALMKGIPFAAWLHRTTRHRAIDLLRSERSRSTREQASGNPTASPVLSEEALALLDEVIDHLPESERRLVVGRFFLGESFSTLSAQAGATEDAVRMRLNRALEKMRQSFSRSGITTTAAILAQVLPAQAVTEPPLAINAAILKSIAAAGTGTSVSISLTTVLQLMTTAQKYTLAGLLLITAIPTALYFSHHPSEKSEAGMKDSSSTSSVAQHSPASPERSARPPRNELDADFTALAAKYGEAEARRAKIMASQSASLMRDITGSEKIMDQNDAMVGQQIESLSKVLKLTPEQTESLKGMRAEISATRRKEMQDLATAVEQNLPALAEVFLAVDAQSRDKIDEATYQETLRDRIPALSVGNTQAWNLLGLESMKEVYKAEDPFAGMPDAAQNFSAQLNPDQQRDYQQIRDTNASYTAGIPKITRKDLDGLDSNVKGMRKIIEAIQLLDPEQFSKGKR